jgi:hypothetical protein
MDGCIDCEGFRQKAENDEAIMHALRERIWELEEQIIKEKIARMQELVKQIEKDCNR